MEMSRATAVVLLMMGSVLCIGGALALEVLHAFGVRRYERKLDNTYAADFKQRAEAVRSLDLSVAQRLRHSKSVLKTVRETSSDTPIVKDALDKVSELLKEAAQESDLALQTFESSRLPILHNTRIVRKFYADCKANPNHDR